jgi:hypothetical protein
VAKYPVADCLVYPVDPVAEFLVYSVAPQYPVVAEYPVALQLCYF